MLDLPDVQALEPTVRYSISLDSRLEEWYFVLILQVNFSSAIVHFNAESDFIKESKKLITLELADHQHAIVLCYYSTLIVTIGAW